MAARLRVEPEGKPGFWERWSIGVGQPRVDRQASIRFHRHCRHDERMLEHDRRLASKIAGKQRQEDSALGSVLKPDTDRKGWLWVAPEDALGGVGSGRPVAIVQAASLNKQKPQSEHEQQAGSRRRQCCDACCGPAEIQTRLASIQNDRGKRQWRRI